MAASSWSSIVQRIGVSGFLFAVFFSDACWGAQDSYLVQGEYLGTYSPAKTGSSPWAAQVVALDRVTKFRITFAKGGLPGEGWDKTTQKDAFANSDGTRVVFTSGGTALTVEGGGDSLVIADNQGGSGVLKKVHRVSPTANRPAPTGALVLFNGMGTTAWKDGKTTSDSLLLSGATTLKTFQDFNLHLEFRMPYSVTDALYPDRGNSGVYLQNRFELQIYDSFGWQPPYDTTYDHSYGIDAPRSCGSLYQISAPKINATYPPGTWQTYDIAFKAAKFDGLGNLTAGAQATVYQNGVLIQDKVNLMAVTLAAVLPMNNLPGPIFLQFHLSDIVYKNIWLEENPSEPIGIPVSIRKENQAVKKLGLSGTRHKVVRLDGRVLRRSR